MSTPSTPRKPRRFVRTFMPQFADKVKTGLKRQTLRRLPKRGEKDMPQPGDLIDCRQWSGRPYNSDQIMLCVGTVTVVKRASLIGDSISNITLILDGQPADFQSKQNFAINDGFADWETLVNWFFSTYKRKAFPFYGYVTYWKPFLT